MKIQWKNEFYVIHQNLLRNHIHSVAYAGGLGGFEPPPTGKNCCRKMMLFPKFLFLAITFPKIDKNSTFPLNFHQKLSKFSQIFPKQLCFSSKRAKIWRMVLKFFCKIGENTTFFAIFFRNFLEIFENNFVKGGSESKFMGNYARGQ